jgi:hypothetical protein
MRLEQVSNSMWRTIFRPDLLFTLATAQALSPYVFWRFGLGEFKGQDNLTYIPVWIWLIGWLAFLLGTRCVTYSRAELAQFRISWSENLLRVTTVVIMIVICVQVVSLVRLYGGYPLLSYIRMDGAIDVVTAVNLQDDAAVGQVGSVYVTTALLHGLVLLLLIRNLERNRRDQWLIAAAFIVLMAAHGVNGKRDGFMRCAIYLLTGLAVYSGDLFGALSKVTRLVRTRSAAKACVLVTACLMFIGIGYLAYIRNQGHYKRNSFEELIAYQEYPLVNFEIQSATTGFGPHKVDYALWMRRLVPWKLMDRFGVEETEMPARYEAWAPAGLYEDVQWSLGIAGSAGFAFVLGLCSMACYRRVLNSPFCLMAYCQIAISLIIAHSFNAFLILAWLPAPVALFWLLSRFLKRAATRRAPLARYEPELCEAR